MEAPLWPCTRCSLLNKASLTKCSVCQSSRSAVLRPAPQPAALTEARGLKRKEIPRPTAVPVPSRGNAPTTLKKTKTVQPTPEAILSRPPPAALSAKVPIENEGIVKEEGDMVHISTMLSRMAAVCRISTRNACGSGFLTAFTRGGQSFVCVMTNNHVIATETQARASVAEFFDLNDPSKGTAVSLQPDALFLTDAGLDFTLVACNRASVPSWAKPIGLQESVGVALNPDDVIHIIQHPSGGEKHMSMQRVVAVSDSRLYYLADTLPGSSGSPVFKNWKLVALHSQGSTVHNIGVLMKSILAKCTVTTCNPSTVRMAAALVAAIAGSLKQTASATPKSHARPLVAAAALRHTPQPSPAPRVASPPRPQIAVRPQLLPVAPAPPPRRVSPARPLLQSRPLASAAPALPVSPRAVVATADACAKAPIAATSLRITNTGETVIVYSLANLELRKWETRTVRGLIEDRVMSEGSLRVVYKAWVLDKFYVVKRFKPHVITTLKLDTEEAVVRLLQEEVVMQRRAWDLAAQWNTLAMPKNVEVNPLFVVKLADRRPPVWAVMEPMLEGAAGAYVKYNDNCGGVFAQEGRVRETPQTFSHFTYLVTGGQWLVCDLQGVGDTFTDPQVHTNPRERCPVAGNHGPKGMDDFFATHQCSPLCEMVKQRLSRAKSGDAVVSAAPRP